MTRKSPPKRAPDKAAETREDRLKKALKANLARRKSQKRVRDADRPNPEQKES